MEGTGQQKGLALQRACISLQTGRFFKLICGGSFTEARKISELTWIYAQAGIDCIDIAPELNVLSAVETGLKALPSEIPPPLVMVSLPLDPDPHFRKIELIEPDCILCGACLPVCPTQAITLPETLEISQDLCYGCGRCVPLCPTDALHLLPFQVEAQIDAVLSHPLVGAVEIHSRHVDPLMLENFMRQWRTRLQDKLIALCFNPTGIEPAQWTRFIEVAATYASAGLILQVDGAPMSGNEHPDASKPALEAARKIYQTLQDQQLDIPITISGGINEYTATYLAQPENAFIVGAGMGTVARQAVWEQLTHEPNPVIALQKAYRLVNLFKQPQKSAIITASEEGMNSGQTAIAYQPTTA